MSAGPFLIDRVATWLFLGWRQKFDRWPHRTSFLATVMVVGVFVAGFLAWKEERAKVSQMRPLLEPSTLYQDGFPSARITTVQIDVDKNQILFGSITADRKIDMSRMVEFRDWKIICSGKEGGGANIGAVVFTQYENVVCRIQGAR